MDRHVANRYQCQQRMLVPKPLSRVDRAAARKYYNQDVSQRARQFASENPKEARERYDRAVNHDDVDAMHGFIARMKGADTESDNGLRPAVPQN